MKKKREKKKGPFLLQSVGIYGRKGMPEFLTLCGQVGKLKEKIITVVFSWVSIHLLFKGEEFHD